MSNIKELEFKKIGDSRGDLVVLEALRNIPFEIKRVYYLVNTKKDVVLNAFTRFLRRLRASVLVNEHYEESDYLTNCEDFLRIVKDASNT